MAQEIEATITWPSEEKGMQEYEISYLPPEKYGLHEGGFGYLDITEREEGTTGGTNGTKTETSPTPFGGSGETNWRTVLLIGGGILAGLTVLKD